MMSEEKISRLNEYIDTEDALKRVMGSKNIYKKLIASYKANNYAGKLVEDHTMGDIAEALKSVHAVKGVAANLSFKKLHELAVQIEANLKSGELCSEMIAEFDAMDKLTREYIDYLTETM